MALAIAAAREGLVSVAFTSITFAPDSTTPLTLCSSDAAVSPGTCFAAASRTARVFRKARFVASPRWSASPTPVPAATSTMRAVAR
jgi:hypothetical protein